jgi:sigma-B regulation protein RsbU (phosphoserine phosphatase)
MAQISSISMDDHEAGVREQLMDRRACLAAISGLSQRRDYRTLLREVDSALERIDTGTYGRCERCHDPVERQRLIGDPLTRVCLDCLSDDQQRALERDLELAASVQHALLPAEHVRTDGWEIGHRYRPHGPVSGDYCDVLRTDAPDAPIHIVLGDVSGKGVSASILMSHLQAVFRSLASLELPLSELAERANRIFCEGIGSNAFSTLLLGRLWPDGTLEMCNAGHCPPLLVQGDDVTPLAATGLPLGLFCESEFRVARFCLKEGDTLFLYTDGLSEATNGSGEQYGTQRVEAIARRLNGKPAGQALQDCLDDLDVFRGDTDTNDDLAVMMVRRNQSTLA